MFPGPDTVCRCGRRYLLGLFERMNRMESARDPSEPEQVERLKILREGDGGRALASERGKVSIVYEYRTLRLERTGVDVRNVLVGVCPETDEILTVPAQSTPQLKAARDAAK